MAKWLKTIIALLLLPACFGLSRTLVRIFTESGGALTVWVPLLAGAGCWLGIYALLPRPMLLYVLSHEATHVLWTWGFGGKVRGFQATSRGGQVSVTRSNFFIALAPYFFPLYVVALVAFFTVGHLVWGWAPYFPWFHLFLGVAYAFHVTLTLSVLRTEQSDITSQGYLFSAVVIWLGNLFVLLIGLPLLTQRVDLPTVFSWCLSDTIDIWSWVSRLATS
jgi:hypothetical protein